MWCHVGVVWQDTTSHQFALSSINLKNSLYVMSSETFGKIWLAVDQRIHFKILLLTYTRHSMVLPLHIFSELNSFQQSQMRQYVSWWSSANSLYPCRIYGEQVFTAAAPILWNALPDYIYKSPLLFNSKIILKLPYSKLLSMYSFFLHFWVSISKYFANFKLIWS